MVNFQVVRKMLKVGMHDSHNKKEVVIRTKYIITMNEVTKTIIVRHKNMLY